MQIIMLKLIKKGDKYWLFEDSEIGLFSPSKFTINLELNEIVIVYENGLKSKRYNVSDCEIYDLGELTPFTTSSGDLFMQKLEELNCPCFQKNENIFNISGGAWGDITGTLSDQTDLQNALDSKLDKSTTPSSVYTTDAGGLQVMKPTSAFGGKKVIRTFYPSWNMANLNTWRGWSRNTSNMLVNDAVSSYGTGTEPTKVGPWFADCNVVFLNGYSKLSKLNFTCRESTSNGQIQLYIVVADYSNNRGYEPNGIIIVNEVFSLNIGSTLKNNFSIAAHSLNPNSVMYIFYRRIDANSNNLQGVQLIFEFE